MTVRTLVAALAIALTATGCGSVSTSVAPVPPGTAPPVLPGAVSPVEPLAQPAATLLALGDVGDCSSSGDRGRATATLAKKIRGPILLLGDVAYPSGSRSDYDKCFWPYWKPLRKRVHAVIGNHDTINRSTFFAEWPDAGSSQRPWHTFRVGAWRVLVVEGNCTVVSCSANAPQTRWLARWLAARPLQCTALAIHQPRFSSDEMHGDKGGVDALWRTAYRGGIDLVLAAHAHDYERVGPVGIAGRPTAHGPVQFVVGTGGAHRRGFGKVTAGSKVRISDTFGLLRLTLRPGSWTARFLAAPSGQVRDTATGTCR